MRVFVSLAATAALHVGATTLASAQLRVAASRSDSAAIAPLLDSSYARFRAAYGRDPRAVANEYHADAFYLRPDARISRGRDAIVREFETVPRLSSPSISFDIVDRGISVDLAYDIGYYELANRPSGKFVVIWKRGGDGRWRIWADAFSGLSAPPAAVAPPVVSPAVQPPAQSAPAALATPSRAMSLSRAALARFVGEFSVVYPIDAPGFTVSVTQRGDTLMLIGFAGNDEAIALSPVSETRFQFVMPGGVAHLNFRMDGQAPAAAALVPPGAGMPAFVLVPLKRN